MGQRNTSGVYNREHVAAITEYSSLLPEATADYLIAAEQSAHWNFQTTKGDKMRRKKKSLFEDIGTSKPGFAGAQKEEKLTGDGPNIPYHFSP